MNLKDKFPPSDPCSCEMCLGFCSRPGWWAVEEARQALDAGLGGRMMLEISPEKTFGVLAPAFKGCEGRIATKRFANQGCTFLKDHLCELFDSGLQPLECRFCHHTRQGQGSTCHAALEEDWARPAGRQIVRAWCKVTGLWDLLEVFGLQALRK